SDVLQHPRFDPTDFERERGRMLSGIQQRRVDPHQVISETFRELLYAGHPLHRPVSGYLETVPRITHADVLAFHQRFYVPANAILVMVGDFTEGKMLELLERHLGNWQTPVAGGAAREPPPRLAPPAPIRGKKVRVVDMDVNQSYVQFGHLAVRRADPAFATLRAMNYILGGGGLVSRLSHSIREEQGLAYSVYSEFVGGSQFSGFFVAGLQTKIESTSQALSSLFDELERMKREPVTADELTDMKLYYEGSLPRRAETYGQVADLLLEREFYELPDGFWVSEIDHIQRLTPAEIQRAAHRYLDTGNFVLALVSKRAKLDLASAPVPVDVITHVPAP
ncbi:MAG: insulinase family protein, partial [Nitrospinae bacterium]|nr:insulinase family protein [Nitrospinota bacterium]